MMGIAGDQPGLIFVHVVYGIGFTTLYFRNYYVSVPDELVSAGDDRRRGLLRDLPAILLPNSGPIIVVTVIWQFTNIWNDFLFGASFSDCESAADDGGAEQPRQHLDRGEGIQRAFGRRRSSRRCRRCSSISSPAGTSCAA